MEQIEKQLMLLGNIKQANQGIALTTGHSAAPREGSEEYRQQLRLHNEGREKGKVG